MSVPCTTQWYGYVPALANVRWYVPEVCCAEVVPSSNVTVCGLRPVHVHVTVAPRATVIAAGVNTLSATLTAVVVVGGVAVVPPVVPVVPVYGAVALP